MRNTPVIDVLFPFLHWRMPRDHGSDDEEEESEDNIDGWTDVAMEIINNHLQLIRTLPWVMGGMGLVLIARYSGAFTRYRRASEVPNNVIRLRGVAVGVWPDGHLDVWHTPFGRRLLRLKHSPPPESYPADQVLSVRLALLKLSLPQKTTEWLAANLMGRPLHLHLIHNTNNSLHCIIYYRKRFTPRLKCANINLLSLGLASLNEPSPSHRDNGYQGNGKLIEFLREGVKEERGAQRRGRGVWRGTVHESWWIRLLRISRLRR